MVKQSFTAAFEAEFAPLYRYLARRVGASTAEDLAAATFEVAYANWDRFERGRPLRPWLYGIAANLIRRHWRNERRMLRAYARTGADPVVGEDDWVSRIEARDRCRGLAVALADLRPQEREVLLLHAWANLTDAEIAAALSLALGTVKSRLHRARQRVRNHIAATGHSAATPPTPEDRDDRRRPTGAGRLPQ